jgi:hypothetical protein
MVILMSLEVPSMGQEWTRAEKILWRSNTTMIDPLQNRPLLYFVNAVYNDPVSHLPFVQEKVKLNYPELKDIQITLNNQFFEAFNDNELALYPSLTHVPDSIVINYTIAYERKVPYLIYSFVPLRRNPLTHKAEKLNSFSIKITVPTHPPLTLKSAVVTTSAFAANSVFHSGDWYKFFVSKSGVYQITYNDLKNMGISDPQNVRIYGNGGKMLPEVYSGDISDDPKEIPIQMVTGSDGIFNTGDYILFYAEGPVTWSFNQTKKTYAHKKHAYNNKVSYFITSSANGAKIQTKVALSGEATQNVTEFDGLDYHEENLHNLIGSGRAWYGEDFSAQTSYNFSFSFPGLTTKPVQLTSEVVGRSSYPNNFEFKQNNISIGTCPTIPAVTMNDDLGYYARTSTFTGNFNASSANITISISYNNNGDASQKGWLSYIELLCRQNLAMYSSQLAFRDKESISTGNIASYTISGATGKTKIWDVTNLHDVQQMPTTQGTSSVSFKAKADELHEYVAFDSTSGFYTPEFISENKGKIANQNLHGLKSANLVIVSHPDFLEKAQELADIHAQYDGLSAIVVTPDQIYNEFSSGMPDPAAIRNFMKMFYDRAASPADMPRYLLLFGDGSYDNRVPLEQNTNNTNYIITYESENSLYQTISFVSDDYFGLLDNDESIVSSASSTSPYTTGLLDIGVGRFPVQNIDQAAAILGKIKKYIHNSFGDWRNRICFIGDDEDDNIHMSQADELATYVSDNYPILNVEKIYLDAYEQVSTSTGQRYPDVNTSITNQLNRGLLILNYTGHGGEKGLAHEDIVRQNEDVKQWKNDTYPLFVTATCEFSKFDDLTQTTAGEDVLLNANGGGIALLTTNRLVYSAPNYVLNQNFYKTVFVKSTDNPSYRLGDILRITKNLSGNDVNKLNFTLLGDPALSLAYPQYSVITDSINHQSNLLADTLNAYETVTIHGHIENESGALATGYNGKIMPVVFDKAKKITTLANDGGTPFEFYLQDNVLFKGQASVQNGEFDAHFMLPKDMDYNYGTSRISYYAYDATIDASGYFNKLITGGVTTNVQVDQSGPSIKLYMNDTLFLNGGVTDENPTLLARVSDENGINPGGNGIGHDITATLDNDTKQGYLLNNYFLSDLDNFKKGSVTFKFSQLSSGTHTVKFKIWDIFNNSASAELTFVVASEDNLYTQRLFNYPNPFSDHTNFFFEHNQNQEDLDATIEIFTTSGNKIREINAKINSTGFTSGPITWDGTDGKGNKISGGIYLYRIILRSLKGTVFSQVQKMIVIKQ